MRFVDTKDVWVLYSRDGRWIHEPMGGDWGGRYRPEWTPIGARIWDSYEAAVNSDACRNWGPKFSPRRMRLTITMEERT